MSDDWLKKADELRKQNHPDNADESATTPISQKKFYNDNWGKVWEMLKALGEAWKAQDPARPGLLIVGRHPGHDYRLTNDNSLHWLSLYLYDKNNLGEKWDSHANELASLWIEFHAGYFEINLPRRFHGYPKQVTTLEDLKAVLAELWANGNIQVSQDG